MTSALPHSYLSVTQLLTAVLQLAAAHHRCGRFAEARALYDEVLLLDPRHGDALFLLGALERQAGRLEQARQHLQEAARWAADRSAAVGELRLVERLIAQRRGRAGQCGAAWGLAGARGTDGAAHVARA